MKKKPITLRKINQDFITMAFEKAIRKKKSEANQ